MMRGQNGFSGIPLHTFTTHVVDVVLVFVAVVVDAVVLVSVLLVPVAVVAVADVDVAVVVVPVAVVVLDEVDEVVVVVVVVVAVVVDKVVVDTVVLVAVAVEVVNDVAVVVVDVLETVVVLVDVVQPDRGCGYSSLPSPQSSNPLQTYCFGTHPFLSAQTCTTPVHDSRSCSSARASPHPDSSLASLQSATPLHA